MLSIGKLTAGGHSERYYTRSVAQGREDYYAGHGEAPGRWLGSGWGSDESDGPVSEADLRTLLEGRHPCSEQPLRRRRTARGVTGFDLTFSAPKSVSILFGVGERDISIAVREAHEHALGEALGYLERAACRTRRGINGRQEVPGEGFLGAAFRHRTSRAGDPQLHTHVVVANATRADGRWGALDGRVLYRHAKTAGYLYQASLRAQLAERLAVRWGPVTTGSAEIEGVPRSLIHHFSRRREEVTRQMAERGEHSRGAARVATLDTRRRKDYDVPVDRLRDQWRARAAEHGFGCEELDEVLDRARRFPPHEMQLARVAAEMGGARGVTREASTFDRRTVVQAWAERHQQGAPARRVEDLTDRWLCDPTVVPLKSGRGSARYSTQDMLATERALLASAERRQSAQVATASRAAVDAAVARRPAIAPEQVDLVDRVVTGGVGVQVVRSAAGTGKTFALDAAREAWQSEGIVVRGCALSARAALELRDQAGIASTTIARLQRDVEEGEGLVPGSVLVVDEAGMVGTRALAALVHHAEAADAKLVLVGDDRQLPEIEAGGAFRTLAERLGTLELREVRRQRQPWDREALGELRHGDVDRFIDSYREHGRIAAAPTAEQTRNQLVDDWWRDTADAPDAEVVIVALRRRDVSDLNDRARERMRAAGRLGPDELDTGGRVFAAGDRVVTTCNDRRLDLANGTRATVTAIDPATRTVRIDVAQRHIELPAEYLDEHGLDHAYAMTAHRLQGATVDRTYVLGSDELYREWGYTALSRHRDSARFYTVADEAQQPLPGLDEHDALKEQLSTGLGRTRAKEMAVAAASDESVTQSSGDAIIALLRSVPNEVRRLPADRAALEVASFELQTAAARLQQTQSELDATGRLRRGRRDELDRVRRSHQSAVEHWTRDRTSLESRLGAASDLRESWLTDHADQIVDAFHRLSLRGPEKDLGGDTSPAAPTPGDMLDRLLAADLAEVARPDQERSLDTHPLGVPAVDIDP